MVKELIFIYNAKSDLLSKATDFAHKLVSPQTYNCSLCAITYSNFSVHKEWADFVSSLVTPVRFFYKNDFEVLYPEEKVIYPVIYIKEGSRLNKLVTASEIDEQKNLGELINLMKEKLQFNITV